ncbi:MAG: hypothetical protein ACW96X_13750 [Promethearchaeota archaeon]|jgi:hypothetical protein
MSIELLIQIYSRRLEKSSDETKIINDSKIKLYFLHQFKDKPNFGLEI